jgi:hypothetical protein
MPSEQAASSNAIRRVVYREITDGDRRKIVAQSNDAESGGGARDFRFSYKDFADVFSRMFPERRTEQRKRNGKRQDVTLFVGQLHWLDGDEERTKEIDFAPPTDARPNDGYIGRVHEYPSLANPPAEDGTVLLLLIQRDDGSVWSSFVTEKSLRGPGWHRDVADRMLACIEARRGNSSVKGFIDFETRESFCNAD